MTYNILKRMMSLAVIFVCFRVEDRAGQQQNLALISVYVLSFYILRRIGPLLRMMRYDECAVGQAGT